MMRATRTWFLALGWSAASAVQRDGARASVSTGGSSAFEADLTLGPALRARSSARAALALGASALAATSESAALDDWSQPEPALQRGFDRLSVAQIWQPAASRDLVSLAPPVWAAIGPIAAPELGTDPITAFADPKVVLLQAMASLESNMTALSSNYQQMRKSGRNHTDVMSELARINMSQPSVEVQGVLPKFPTEYSPGGSTIWAFGHPDAQEAKVNVNFTQAAKIAGVSHPDDFPSTGWAVGSIRLDRPTTTLIRCNEAFLVDDGDLMHLPDAYEEHRAVNVFHMTKGLHHLFVRFRQEPFWCDVLEDSAEARRNITGVSNQSDYQSPLALLSDSMMSDVVEGHLASPYLAVPAVNTAEFPVILDRVELLNRQEVTVRPFPGKEDVQIAAGQAYVFGAMLIQGSKLLQCELNERNQTEFRVQLRLHTRSASDGRALPTTDASVAAGCIAIRAGGYKVTFPDYDGSVQHMWVAPPNVSAFPDSKCPNEGCPVMLSLHGASVIVSGNWGHNYAKSQTDGAPFPYPAWLVEPSNRYHWGTDWEGPGYDDGLAAVEYVRLHMPGVGADDKPMMRVDPERRLLTGHSMGGHGCLVFSVHDPDRLLGSLCAACWTSQARYVRNGGSGLLDELSGGLLRARMSEHAADFLSANLRGVPLKVVYGEDDDNVPPREPRYIARLVDSFSGSVEAVERTELPQTGHWFTQNIPPMANFLSAHLLPARTALPPLPQNFEFTVASVSSFGTKGNLKVLQLSNAGAPGRLFVRRCKRRGDSLTAGCSDEATSNATGGDADGDELWYIDTTNVRRFTLSSPPLRGRPLPRLIAVDGRLFNVSASLARPGQHLCLARQRSQGSLPLWRVCSDTAWESLQRDGPRTGGGPFHNVLRRSRVCIVHGGGRSQAQQALIFANKLYFVSRYAVPIIDGSLPEASQNVSGYCKDANLVFIGHPQDNRLLDENRCAFPYVRFHEGGSGFTLGGVPYGMPGIGLLALGRLQNARLAVVVLGTNASGLKAAGEHLPITSFKDGADYMVLGPDSSWQGEGGVLQAGYLDPLWRASSTSWAEPAHSVKTWGGMSTDGTDDPRCDQVREALLQSDLEISTSGAPGAPLFAAFLVIAVSARLFI